MPLVTLGLSVVGLVMLFLAVRIDIWAGRAWPYRWLRHGFRITVAAAWVGGYSYSVRHGHHSGTSLPNVRGTTSEAVTEWLHRLGADPRCVAAAIGGAMLAHVVLWHWQSQRQRWHRWMGLNAARP